MTLIHNERTKLTANALDRASTACMSIGVLGPAVAVTYNIGGTYSALSGIIVFIGSLVWFTIAAGLHFAARWLLRRLE